MMHLLRAWGIVATVAFASLLCWSSNGYSETVIGSWESGAAEGWIDWSLGQTPIDVPILPGRWAFNATGATAGTKAVQFHSDGGYWQFLALKLQLGSNGVQEWRPDFLNNTKLAFDLTLVQGQFDPANDFVSNNIIINAGTNDPPPPDPPTTDYGFHEQSGPESIEPFVGQNLDGMGDITTGFNPTLLVGTQKSTWVYDIGYLHDGIDDPGKPGYDEIPEDASWIEIIFVQYSGSASTIHIDNVRLFTPVVGLPGDYNGDEVVNAADYTIWRDTLSSTTDLRADGSGPTAGVPDGVIDLFDYDYWKANFGAEGSGTGSGSLAPGVVPEAASGLLALLALSMTGFARLGRRAR